MPIVVGRSGNWLGRDVETRPAREAPARQDDSRSGFAATAQTSSRRNEKTTLTRFSRSCPSVPSKDDFFASVFLPFLWFRPLGSSDQETRGQVRNVPHGLRLGQRPVEKGGQARRGGECRSKFTRPPLPPRLLRGGRIGGCRFYFSGSTIVVGSIVVTGVLRMALVRLARSSAWPARRASTSIV